jgi:citrate synthase
MPNSVELKIKGKPLELPIVVGSEGEKAIDIRQLRAQTGDVTLAQGFINTGAVTSNIAFIDGDAGVLHYRGIAIEVAEEAR